MGRKGDQDYGGETYRPTTHTGQTVSPSTEDGGAPPLPPRFGTTAIPNALDKTSEAPPPYAKNPQVYHSQPVSQSWSAQDPRSSSTQSLVPHQSTEGNGKRTLLLVYIHGFMGNETSFQSFPAHVHNIVTVGLAESHVVHTKIYPKYKSRNHVEFARDGFSEWLRPHESPDTDVILLGHSMGGILSAEVALLENHRILGTMNFDTPFLGMHPGVIASGLGSLFRPAPDSPAATSTGTRAEGQPALSAAANGDTESSSSSSYFGLEATSSRALMPSVSNSSSVIPMPSSSSLDPPVNDPNYDPPFVNDIRIPQRSGWASALHFINKHSDGLTKATQSYVKSHLEFGGAMADYNGLKKRYEKVRALEDVEPKEQTRVRFVNYYTASTGRPKKPKSSPVPETQINQLDGVTPTVEEGVQSMNLETPTAQSSVSSNKCLTDKLDDALAPRKSAEDADEEFYSPVEGYSDDGGAVSDASQAMELMDPAPVLEDEPEADLDKNNGTSALKTDKATALREPDMSKPASITTIPQPEERVPNLPPVPAKPTEPPPFDPAPYTDKDTRKLAEKDHARLVKAYRQAVKDHERAISDRRKFLEKREKNAAKDREKLVRAEEKKRLNLEKRGMEKGERERVKVEKSEEKRLEKEKARLEKEEIRMKAEKEKLSARLSTPGNAVDDGEAREVPEKPKRDKKFCMLPPQVNGRVDRCWVRVFMPGVDEVGAHCGLFFVDGERYRNFVNDVANRIKMWVEESNGV